MGEALMPRRGRNIKAGFVGSRDSVLQCDDWIGAKNITVSCGAYLSVLRDMMDAEIATPEEVNGSVLMVRVVSGLVQDIWYIDSTQTFGLGHAEHPFIHFSPSTGTLHVEEYSTHFVPGNCYGNDFEYEYVVY